jgi:prepilin-type N-terminal cleavage/methylation domain-containing protein
MRRLDHKGFTIIELLIATVIFSVILLIITGAIIQFSKIYYKGVISSRTQESARNIMSDVSGAVQFSGISNVSNTPPPGPGGVGYICIGSKRYSYRLNVQVTGTQHAIIADSPATCAGAYSPMVGAIPAGSTASELLGEGMQLVNIDVQQVAGSNLYTIALHVAYGADSDLVLPARNECKALIQGGQFCAVIKLNATVAKRIE